MQATLRRLRTSDEGTFGRLVIEGQEWVTGELPDRNNVENFSCIPAGTYECYRRWSPKFIKNVYIVDEVPGRTFIEFHVANFFGDKLKKLRSDVEGCIGLGKNFGRLDGQEIILNSATAVKEFEKFMNERPFTLTIIDQFRAAVSVS